MTKKKGTLLWQIEGPLPQGDSYLFGTMHVKDTRAFARLETVYEKIAACPVFCTEIALDAALDFPFTTFLLPSGQRLDQLLSHKKYDKLRRILLKAYGLDLEKLKNFKPIVVANMIDEQVLQNEMPEALDRHLWNYAKGLGKICCGVEEVSEQIELLRQMPIDKQLQGLLNVGRNVSAQRRRVRSLAHAYKEGDVYRIYQMARRGSGKFRQTMIFQRNRQMADRLSKMMEEDSLFFAVGAGHLAGDKGLIRLLKKRGYRLRVVS